MLGSIGWYLEAVGDRSDHLLGDALAVHLRCFPMPERPLARPGKGEVLRLAAGLEAAEILPAVLSLQSRKTHSGALPCIQARLRRMAATSFRLERVRALMRAPACSADRRGAGSSGCRDGVSCGLILPALGIARRVPTARSDVTHARKRRYAPRNRKYCRGGSRWQTTSRAAVH